MLSWCLVELRYPLGPKYFLHVRQLALERPIQDTAVVGKVLVRQAE